MSRASVVYLRHWQLTGSETSKHKAYEMLRGLAYFQTVSGPNAGNVVLWMQPDGTLNPVADPPELPSPSDSGESYWLARTTWALGEGYAAFHGSPTRRPGVRVVPRATGSTSRSARSSVSRSPATAPTGRSTGSRLPAWLVVDGADASAEAVLGLSAYVAAGGRRRRPATRCASWPTGIAQMGGGDARTWPFGAVLPWAVSLADWHAWALADAGRAGPCLAQRWATRRSPRPPCATRRPSTRGC